MAMHNLVKQIQIFSLHIPTKSKTFQVKTHHQTKQVQFYEPPIMSYNSESTKEPRNSFRRYNCQNMSVFCSIHRCIKCTNQLGQEQQIHKCKTQHEIIREFQLYLFRSDMTDTEMFEGCIKRLTGAVYLLQRTVKDQKPCYIRDSYFV